MNHRIEQRPELNVVGYALRTTTVGGENMRVIPQLWDRCNAEKKVAQLDAIDSGAGVLGLCAEFDNAMEAFTYIIGVEAEPGAKAPEGTKWVKVPAATYAVFSVVGAMPDAIQKAWGEIMGSWMPQSRFVQSSPINFELYPAFPEGDERGDPTSPRCYTEIWLPIREK